MAIEEGNFTTAFFKQNAVRDLFGEGMAGAGQGLRDMLESQNSQAPSPVAAAVVQEPEAEPGMQEWEKAIEKVEEREDIAAAKTSKAEAKAEFAEFDEDVPLDAEAGDANDDDELERIVEELTPVERYALKFLESTQDHQDILKQAEVRLSLCSHHVSTLFS